MILLPGGGRVGVPHIIQPDPSTQSLVVRYCVFGRRSGGECSRGPQAETLLFSDTDRPIIKCVNLFDLSMERAN